MTVHHTSSVDPYAVRRTVIGWTSAPGSQSAVASGGRVAFTSPEHAAAYIAWTKEFERDVRRHERALIGSLLDAAITEKQHVSLQHALRKLDPEAARTAGTIVHLLVSILADEAAECAA